MAKWRLAVALMASLLLYPEVGQSQDWGNPGPVNKSDIQTYGQYRAVIFHQPPGQSQWYFLTSYVATKESCAPFLGDGVEDHYDPNHPPVYLQKSGWYQNAPQEAPPNASLITLNYQEHVFIHCIEEQRAWNIDQVVQALTATLKNISKSEATDQIASDHAAKIDPALAALQSTQSTDGIKLQALEKRVKALEARISRH